jgi:1-aminocyclopropane-1-carboxylate deaminase/D-cysteine desulfhydrase-like pyridoxal-dependent ACC family enzyme
VADDPGLEDREAMAGAMDRIADAYRRQGRHPYVLYSSVHPLGAVSYVECAVELAEQLANRTAEPVNVFTTSMGVTHVGLALGFAALGLPWKVTAITWRPEVPGLAQRLAGLADATARLLNLDNPLGARDFVTLDYGGPEYGVPSHETWEAIALCARTEGLFVDPVYSGKGMAGLIDQIRRGSLEVRDLVVFVHTGGLPALFAYADAAVDSQAFKDTFA